MLQPVSEIICEWSRRRGKRHPGVQQQVPSPLHLGHITVSTANVGDLGFRDVGNVGFQTGYKNSLQVEICQANFLFLPQHLLSVLHISPLGVKALVSGP